MAYLKVRHKVNQGFSGGKYHDDNSYRDVINYIMQPGKTPSGYIGGMAVNLCNAVYEMEKLSEYFGQNHGVRLRHMIIAFEDSELCNTKSASLRVAYKAAHHIAQFYGKEYQIVYAVHEDTGTVHIHFVMNTTNYITGRKYNGSKRDLYQFIDHIENCSVLSGIKVKLEKDLN